MSTHEPGLEGLSRQEKIALLERLGRQKSTVARTFPLSFAQQRMWFLDRLDPGNPANNIFRAVTLTGSLDGAVLARALSEIVRRHGALRTVFPPVGEEPRQRVTPAVERGLPLPRVDLSALPLLIRGSLAKDLAGSESRHAFDLARGPLFRAALLRLDAAEHVLLLGFHHIVADGWSLGILFGELTALYRVYLSGRPSPLPALKLQYADFSVWQRERMAGERLASELDWWREQIGEAATVLELPADRIRPAVESFRGSLFRFALPAAAENGVRALGRESGATLFMTLLAAFEVVLYRYTRQPSFLVGTTVAGRHRPEAEELIGFFANTLLLPAALSGNSTFRELLTSVRRSTLSAYGHQELPFERLVEELHPERDLSHNPLFQVMLSLQNLPEQGLSLPGLTLGELDVERGLSKLDLTLDLTESKGENAGIEGYFEYSTDLFEPATIARMTGCFLTLLAGIVAGPDRPLSELPLLDRTARERILFGFNPSGYELAPTVPGRIAAQARRTPEAPAVLCGDERLSYAELDSQANRLARYLRRHGVGPDILVGLCLERSLGLSVALLGILKAGAAYVPLDPDYPRERLALMIEDTRMPVLLTVSALAARLPVGPTGPDLLLLDVDGGRLAAIAAESPADPDWEVLGEGLAYVVYTSGSAGRPKGVGVPHRALANHAAECARAYGLGPADRVLQFTSISFDITSEEIFPTWISGGAVVPRAPGLFPSFAELETLLDRHGVTVVNLPTAYWHEWASELHRLERRPPASLRLAIIGTEQALPERLAEWLTLPGLPGGEGVRFANSYASTECTVTALIHLSGPGSLGRARAGHRIPVGRPIGNCRVYVLDEAMEPVPVGVPGDIYIGGANVSRGYLQHPERTAAVFLPDPFATCGPGGRLYRQGDLGRFLPSGELECLGRSDDQVKIRGFRVEPGEIEAVLARHPGVRECVVLVRDLAAADRRLVGYVAADPDHRVTAEELRLHLRASLPEYMVPAGLVVLKNLPLTTNGKVDRRALLRLDPRGESTGETDGTAGNTPSSPVEELVLQIWSQVLRRERIGRHDNFFDLGGHSLLVTQVISRVRQALGVDLPLRTLFEAPTVAAFVAAVEKARSGGGVPAPPIGRVPRGGPLPTSFAQQRLWVVDQLTPGSPAYNLSDALRFEGALDIATLSRALDEIVRRHEVLRTTFAVVDGQAVQIVAPPAPLALQRVDLAEEVGLRSSPRTGSWLREAPEGAGPQERTEPGAEVLRWAAAEGRRPFDLGRGPLFRAVLYRLAAEDHLLSLSLHHSVSDGNSNRLLLAELLALYTAFSLGEPSPLPELPVQYADYAAWQRSWLRGEVLADQIAYWRRQLAGAPPVLELPTDRPRPAVESADGARHTFTLKPALARDLKALGRREGTTRFMTLLAGFDALLARWSRQDDLVVGWPIAGRGRAELEPVIGFFSNMLVQRARMEEGLSFARLLGQVRGTALDAYSHGDLPFELLVYALRPERDLSHNPIFQVFFVLHDRVGEAQAATAAQPIPPLPGVTVHQPHIATGSSLLDLSFAVTESESSLDAVFEYKTALFDGATVERMAGHLANLLASAVAAPGVPLAELPMLSAAERRQLVLGWNETACDVPLGTTAHGLFEAQAAAAPGNIALVTDDEISTYGDLDARANRLAHRLRRLGVGPGSLVGICLERSAAMVAALLAVLKSGGAYVPLDPTYPAERLAFLLADGGIRFLLTTGDLASVLPLHDATVLDLDGEVAPEALLAESAAPPAPLAGPEDLAYVLYTSGSTGKPKGVEVRHAGLANFLLSMARRPGLTAADTLLAVTTISFDIAGLEIYLPLAVGGRVVLASRTAAMDGRRLAALLHDSGATAMQATPATWRLLVDSGWAGEPGLKTLCGGEALPAELARELLARVGSLWNVYGPTETTIWSALQPVTASGEGTLPIGLPIANTALHLLDAKLGLVPVGVVGELYIGGAGLARGYLGRPALTAERFVPDPFAGPGARLYRTGDLARRLPGGELEFLGRADTQVKVRGFRIEPGEIEAVLEAHPAVRQAVVVVREAGEPSSAQLVAYVVAAGPAANPGLLRAALREELPEYMVPSLFVLLAELPLTPNGKVDRKALPSPSADPQGGAHERAAVAPRTPVERQVAEIWAEILGMQRISIDDNFFELGGHSLMATQVISRLEDAFGVELGLPAIFKTPTVAGLAAAILTRREAPLRTAIPRASREPGRFPLSFAQQRLWFLNQYAPESPEYNIPQGFRIRGPLSAEILRLTLETIVARHEALRTTFQAVEGVPLQILSPGQLVELTATDLRARPLLTQEEREAAARSLASEDARLPFDLTLGPLLRPLLFRIDEEEHLFFLNFHHIVYDGWSRGVLLAELAAIYSAFAEGRPSPFPELAVQYLDFALWQRGWLAGEVRERQLSYWRQRLAGTPPLDLLTDRPRPAVRTSNGGSEAVFLPRPVVESLTRLGQAEGGTLFVSLAAAWKALLHHYTGQEDLTAGTLIANRTRPELERIIGFFANTLALRTDLSGDPPFRQLVAREREVALGAYAHQDLPFESLVNDIRPERDLARTPIFQNLLILLNTPARALDIPGLALSELAIDNATAKFELTLYMVQEEEGISGYLEYNIDLFDATTVRRFLDHFRTLASGAAAAPELPLSELPWISAAETGQLLAEWNATAADFPRELCLHEQIALQAARTPGAVAVELAGEILTYGDLDSRANRLARHLRSLGVGPEVLVGLAVERSFEMVVGLLGILKAGGAYLPLDPEHPRDRLAFLLEDSRLSLLLTEERLLTKLPVTSARILALDRDRAAIAAEEDRAPVSGVRPENLAYLLYTSGSTGKPKGVEIPHRAMVNFLASMSRRPGMTSADTLLAVTTLSFDIAGLELYLPLVTGARVVLVPREVAQDGEQLLDRLVRSGATVMQATPATWRLLVEAGFEGDGRLKILCGGEALPRDLADSLLAGAGSLWNVYGPTETTIWSMVQEIERGGRITLGRPLDNTQVYLFSERLHPVPVGVPGELHIGGAGLARGYRSRPDLTAERFLPDPYSRVPGARLYKTGDLARHLADGTVDLLGRIDTQVKVRGFRIELGEIETVLAEHPEVAQAVVLAREDTPGMKRLVAYLVPRSPGEAPKSAELLDALKARLPEYMIPTLFVTLPLLPLTPNGKIDRRRLPAPDQNRESEGLYVAPSSPVEVALAALWAELLGIARVGRNDDFFALGGDSLLVLRVVAKAHQNGLAITARQLFLHRTVAELAKVVGETAEA